MTFFMGVITKKTGTFQIASANAKVRHFLTDVESQETEKLELETGQKVTVFPIMCGHKFAAITLSQVIEYYSTAFD